MTTESLRAMREYLAPVADGPVGLSARSIVEQLLARAWADLGVDRDDEGMAGYKVLGRTENLTWRRPVLSFSIARHGGTVLGSTREVLQDWSVNVDTGEAQSSPGSFRQAVPRPAPLKVGLLVEQIVDAVQHCGDHAAVSWLRDGRVQVTMQRIPELGQFKRTRDGRSRRFQETLIPRMAEVGWRPVPGPRLIFDRRGQDET